MANHSNAACAAASARRVALTEAGVSLLADAYKLWKSAQAAVAGTITDMHDTADRLAPIIKHFW